MKRNGNNRAMMASKTRIPEGWRLVRLGDVAEANRSGWSRSDDATILYLDLTSIVVPGIMSCPKELAAAEAPSRARRRVHSGDILVSTVRPNLRGFARVREAPKNLIASTGFAVLTPMSDVDGSYVYHHVMTQQFADYLEKATTGQAYPAVRPADVTNFVLPIPPLPEQRAIAAVLDAIDDAIERTDAVIAATEQLRDSLLHELLNLGVPGWHTAWKDVTGLGTMPADWDMVRLGDVAEIVMGQSPPGGKCNRVEDGVPLLNGPTEFGPYYPTPVQWTTDPKKGAGVGDILFCVRGATAGRMNWSDRDYAIGRGIASLKHKGGPAYQRFLRAVIDFRLAELLTVVTGSTFPNLSYDQITQLRVPRVPSSEQQAIADTLDGIDGVLVQRRLERDALRSLKDSTADALLTGLVKAIR